jgi:hypothetical protein
MPLGRQRIVIVRPGAIDLFERLKARFAEDPDTVMIWDRRTGQDRRRWLQSVPVERRIRRRRHPNGAAVLASRGFFVVRPIRRDAG